MANKYQKQLTQKNPVDYTTGAIKQEPLDAGDQNGCAYYLFCNQNGNFQKHMYMVVKLHNLNQYSIAAQT